MTYYSSNGKPLPKKLEKQIDNDELLETLNKFIAHLKLNYSEEYLSPSIIHEIFLKFHGKSELGLLRLMRKLRDTGNFPLSKVHSIKGKAVRLYHIR